MTPRLNRLSFYRLRAATLAALWLASAAVALAAPGAHGPNGEHLDAPASVGAASSLPRVEAKSESFELVATLHASELSVLIDRYASNEPVLNAVLEVETGGVKSKATFHADQGDYAIDDPKLLAVLRAPGEHALVFTLAAGADNDLLDGTLVTAAGGAGRAKSDHGHAHGDDDHGHALELGRAAWMGAGVAALGLVGGIAWWRQRRRHTTTQQGSL